MAWVQLDLFEDVTKLPWYGRSPRSLTRCAGRLFLKRKRERTPADFDGDQIPMFAGLVRKKAPREYRGAPLLQEVDYGEEL